MTMLKSVTLLSIIILTFGSQNECGTAGDQNDEWAYSNNTQLEGKVTILNHPELGKTPDSGGQIVFQRVDCRKCVISVHADSNGKYEIGVKQGRFRVIVQDGTREGESRDVLAPNQPRYVDVGPPSAITRFDIEILLPKN